jgi:histidinol-phosphate aminotransferase
MTHPRHTPPIQSLPAAVPFVGPEEQERARGWNRRGRGAATGRIDRWSAVCG